jgi:hypothetical protein
MTTQITNLTEVTNTEDGDLLLIRDATDGVDKKMQAQNLRAKATTKDDVGLGSVPNVDTTDAVNKAHDQNTDTALNQGGANEVTAADARAHIDSTSNPHGVTKTQVGLGDVDNVSAADLRDRSTHTGTQPISSVSGLQADLDGKVPQTAATGSAEIPAGTQGERDGTPSAGYFRFNTDSSQFEGYDGTSWGEIGGGAGATGGGDDEVFIQNDQAVTADYTIPADKNALTTGPIDIDAGVTVTVSTGSRWVVL